MKVFSVTQSNQIDLCGRQRWFERVRKLPLVQKKHFAFGLAIDGVINRWLEADDTGRKDGKPVDLYPQGWDKDILPEEADRIKILVHRAIEQGVLRRLPGRQVQREIFRPLVADWMLKGFIDIDNPEVLEDNKSLKSFRYAKNEDTLKEDIQLRIYAADKMFAYVENGEEPPQEFLIRQNYYCKDPENLKVRYTEAKVSLQEVMNAWEHVKQNAEIADKIDLVKDWRELPDPGPKACYAFGGCAFQTICGKHETLEEYVMRVNRFNQGIKDKENNMSLMDKLKARGATTPTATASAAPAPAPAAAAAAPAPQAAPTNGTEGVKQKLSSLAGLSKPAAAPQTAPSPAPAQKPGIAALKPLGSILPGPVEPSPSPGPVEVEQPEIIDIPAPNSAPWAQAGCKACGGAGMATNGKPCIPCVSASEQSPEQYEVSQEGGELKFEKKPVNMNAGSLKPAEPQRGRPKEGFTLYINCMPTKTTKKVSRLEEVYAIFAQQVAESSQAKNFFQLDAFARRDAISQFARSVADHLGSGAVVCSTNSPDLNHFLLALSPLAKEVVEGISR